MVAAWTVARGPLARVHVTPPGYNGPMASSVPRGTPGPQPPGAAHLPTTGSGFPHVVPNAHGGYAQGYCPSNPQGDSVMVNAS
jgi:hypothetical protein